MWTMNFQMFKLDLEKADQIANICWIIEKAREFQKILTSALLPMLKPLTVCITTSYGKFLKKWEYQITCPSSWEICMQFKKQHLEQDMEQQTGSKFGKAVCQGCILSSCLFNLYEEYIMRNARVSEPQARIKNDRRNINNLRYTDDTTLMTEVKKN